jgi:hypothetical protein
MIGSFIVVILPRADVCRDALRDAFARCVGVCDLRSLFQRGGSGGFYGVAQCCDVAHPNARPSVRHVVGLERSHPFDEC